MRSEKICGAEAVTAATAAENAANLSTDQLVNTLVQLEKIRYTTNEELWDEKGENVARSLLPLLADSRWEVRAKALITMGRVGDSTVAADIISWLQSVDEPWWQLQGLDCWWQLPLDDEARGDTLAKLISWAYQPVTVRGLVWLLQDWGTPKAARLFAHLAVSKKSMVVKDEMMSDAWFALADKIGQAEQERLSDEVAGFRVWLNFRYREEEPSKYSLYPSPDYLWQCAEDFGVERKNFKKLYHKPRKKDNLKTF